MTKEPSTLQEARDILMAAPKRVHLASFIATLVGILFMLRMLVSVVMGDIALGKAVLLGTIVAVVLFLNGYSLIHRSRSGYLVVTCLIILPVLGMFTHMVRGINLIVIGIWNEASLGALRCGLSTIQFLSTAVLLFLLFSRDTRTYVWGISRNESEQTDSA